MLTYARIAGGTVAELIEIDSDGPTLAERYHPDLVAACVPVADPAGVVPGSTWDGGAFGPPPEAEPLLPVVPDISARQLRLWLLAQGVALVTIDDAIAALPEAEREPARVEWEYATVYQRAHPLIALLAPVAGLMTAEAIDDAFRAAALL